ncbi:MAG: 23S rRNA (adenine(2030)-N(6))-methyltransferase RlmJ [Lautropia sp.]|nr:23S rRNA (adenine(2030)-N(6))-methyltransferase RlmJ [Lautropia sp.]
MFSYRHAFHAGNHADVLKHAILVAILKHLAQKDKAFWVFDTHAGAGEYRLDAAQARKNAEHRGGIVALWSEKALPPLLADYRLAVARFGIAHHERAEREQLRREGKISAAEAPVGDVVGAGDEGGRAADVPPLPSGPNESSCAVGTSLSTETRLQQRLASGRLFQSLPVMYPGSPALALQFMRPQDRMRCFEAHPNEIRVLQRNLSWAGRRLQIFGEDGFDGLKALLPPVSRRGMVLIDPSYEDKRDYARARRTLLEALERFATGTMVLWYPLVRRREAALLMEQIHRLPAGDWLDVRLQVCRPPEDGHGLYGSGMFVINPPYTLAEQLKRAMPVLQRLLGQDASAGWLMTTSADAPRGAPVQAESRVGRRLDRSPLARERMPATDGRLRSGRRGPGAADGRSGALGRTGGSGAEQGVRGASHAPQRLQRPGQAPRTRGRKKPAS